MTDQSKSLRDLAHEIVKAVDYDIYKDILEDEDDGTIPTIMMMIQDWAMSDE